MGCSTPATISPRRDGDARGVSWRAMRIREATLADARSIAGIHVRAWQAAYRGQMPDQFLDSLSVEDRLAQHEWSLRNPRETWRHWVADDEGGVVGFAVTGPSEDADADERTGEVYAIYLEPGRVGTGVGRALFERAVDDLRSRGFRTATLWVLESNQRARRFYDAAGWKADGTTASERIDCAMLPTVRYRSSLI
jgi:GNAT superfamily N-acetyltransferase